MGPGEVIAALALFVGMPWAVFSGIAKIKAASHGGGGSREGASLRKSELEAIIGTAVEDATAPLIRRVETLEAIVTQEEAAMDRIDPAVLADALDHDAEADAPAGARRRTRE
ncbi:hypothetical protein [Rubrivirga marina]|uniref:Uncharacterized protein n=1 Tax=Rubrivirga marina TaxID=1196024 RepID=A0A271J223_9BACT|nr:hypothetical protein [Rubrivirga marina]PAP77308.1 hypothetical protein BSZ37_13120 [Rubrivirga marina]